MSRSDQPTPEHDGRRFGKQLQRLRLAVQRKREQSRARAEEQSLISPQRPPEQLSPRAKNSGHRKKTADKWNQ